MVSQVRTRSTPSADVVCAELDGEAILLNTSTGLYFGLDAVGTRAWTLLGQGLTDDQVHAQLFAEYEVSAEVLWTHLDGLLDQLVTHGLVSRSTEA